VTDNWGRRGRQRMEIQLPMQLLPNRLSRVTLRIRIPFTRGVLNKTLCDKADQ